MLRDESFELLRELDEGDELLGELDEGCDEVGVDVKIWQPVKIV